MPDKIKPMITVIDFKYSGVDYDYDELHSCDEVCFNDYCRCGRIVNARVTSIDKARIALEFIDALKKSIGKQHNLSDMDKLAVDRIVAAQNLSPDDFDIEVGGGYYGEEIYGVRLSSTRHNEILEQINRFGTIDPADLTAQVEYLLEVEYGYVLDDLKGKTFTIEEISLDDVVFAARGHYVRLDADLVASYKARFDKNLAFRSVELDQIPVGIVEADGPRFRVIDGYHRFKALQELTSEKTKTIVAR